MASSVEDARQSLPGVSSIDPIPRPASTSSQFSTSAHSASLPQLPGLAALASMASGRESPVLRPYISGPRDDNQIYQQSPVASVGGVTGGVATTCANCSTSTTPLWRRDEQGLVLCNACGLFLKLHGRPRPISLKTDVIKSRNRVKTAIPGQPGQKKKSFMDNANGLDMRSQNGTPTGRISHKDNHDDGSTSPLSRNGTPSMYANHLSAFDGALNENQFHAANLNGLHLRASSPGRSESSMNGGHMEPQTYEQLIAVNSSLKTRVSELEVINELFRGRVTQLEQDEANARRGEEMRRDSEAETRGYLEDSQRRENQLKRRLDDLERELAELRETAGPSAKRQRLNNDLIEESQASTPQEPEEFKGDFKDDFKDDSIQDLSQDAL